MAFSDSSEHRTLTNIARSGFAVTPNDSTDLTTYAEALYVGVTGDVKVDLVGGGTLTFKAHPVGYMPCSVSRVYSTGTTAAYILGLY